MCKQCKVSLPKLDSKMKACHGTNILALLLTCEAILIPAVPEAAVHVQAFNKVVPVSTNRIILLLVLLFSSNI